MDEGSVGGRKLEDILTVIKHAKLDPDDLHPTTQSISMPDKEKMSEKYLLELDAQTLQYVQEGKV